MIAIVDYQAGNLASVRKAFDHLGHESAITADAEAIVRADKIVVPGVGNFEATTALGGPLQEAFARAIDREIPLLGICLGMQWMFESSQEAPQLRGLGLFAGECEKFPAEVKSPHVGWNRLQLRSASRLLHGLPEGSFVYFTHSYRAPVVEATVASCAYGGSFSAAVERGQLFGVQFHPEKSGTAGLQLLRNFCEL
ncbi:MAG TPA: imidazole glycerol phosphate synthase subunit HisH [Terriglobales bacterium]|jgi:glutamine amidotransferase|nr:imidazole glycerol phosphate synthase subunit HisH [Terriglobales bacterium]